MSESIENKCRYQFPPDFEASSGGHSSSKGDHYSSCYRSTWKDHDRCIWHAKTDEPKPVDDLKDVREDPDCRELNIENGPAEILDGAHLPGTSIDTLSDLDGCYLRRANLQDVHFSEGSCRFAELADADLDQGWFRGTDFTGSSLSQVSLIETTLKGATLTKCKLENAHLERTNLHGAEMSKIWLYGATLNNVKITEKTEFGDRCVYDPEFKGESAVNISDDDTDQLTKASGQYRALEQLARSNAFPDMVSQNFIYRKDIHRRQHWEEGRYRRWAQALISRLSLLYGESPWRVIGTSAVIIAIFGVLYSLVGGVTVTTKPSTHGFNLPQLFSFSVPAPIETLLMNIYFSVVTFTTLGYGDVQPSNAATQALAGIESLLGATLIALLVFVLGRRAAR
ncbi:pentapeptide repeat-containing protein [Haloarcula hispanica]|uniref:pentapeptide repeat-containing protein n=1 Tax=Haloarcula hispanica TaxID=51589 RepID=UPI0011B6B1F8|nr:pentapeptide repeat-containing protein [Haloarcula hispanica]